MNARTKPNRREQILTEAAALFSAKGYQATGMRELAEQVGIEPASLYSHFSSKELMLWEIANRCAQEFLQAARNAEAAEPNPLRRMEALILGHVEVTLRNQQAAALFDTEWQHLGPNLRAEYAALRNAYEQIFRETIVLGQQAGVFRASDPKFAALAILSALNFTYKWYRPSGSMTPEEVGRKLSDVLLNGLR